MSENSISNGWWNQKEKKKINLDTSKNSQKNTFFWNIARRQSVTAEKRSQLSLNLQNKVIHWHKSQMLMSLRCTPPLTASFTLSKQTFPFNLLFFTSFYTLSDDLKWRFWWSNNIEKAPLNLFALIDLKIDYIMDYIIDYIIISNEIMILKKT